MRLREARQQLFHALDQINLTVHSFDPSGLSLIGPVGNASSTLRGGAVAAARTQAVEENLQRQGNLTVLPERTGGRTVVNTNGPEERVKDVYRESRSYYLVGFTPASPAAAPGQFRRIQVKVNRRGVDVHSRGGYVMTPVASPAAGASPASVTAAGGAVANAIAGLVPDGSALLDVNAAVFATPGAKTGLVALAIGMGAAADSVTSPGAIGSSAAPGAGAAPAATGRVEIVAAAFDHAGRPRGSARQTFELAGPGSDAGSHRRVEGLSRLDLPPGDYEIRIGVTGGGSLRAASVFTYVTVLPFATLPFSLSSVVLSATPTTISAPRDFLSASLPTVPTTRREFARTEQASGFLRVYQGTSRTDRLAPVQVRLRVLDATGQEAAAAQVMTLGVDQFTKDRTADCRFPLPLARLAPGEYLMAIDAAMGERTAGRALRFSVK